MSDQEISAPCGHRSPRTAQELFFHRCVEEDQGFATPCWIWLWSLDKDGYGRFKPGGQGERRAHRWAYEHFIGPVPKGLHVHHRCSTPACVNPAHLEAVTCRENLLLGDTYAARAAAQTHCIHGHPFDEENTYIAPGGARQCRECQRRRKREYDARTRAAA